MEYLLIKMNVPTILVGGFKFGFLFESCDFILSGHA